MKKKLGEVTLRDIVFNVECDGCETCGLVKFCENITNIYCTQPDSSFGVIEAFFDTEEVECLNDNPGIIDWKKAFAGLLDQDCPYGKTSCESMALPSLKRCGRDFLLKCWIKWYHENR